MVDELDYAVYIKEPVLFSKAFLSVQFHCDIGESAIPEHTSQQHHHTTRYICHLSGQKLKAFTNVIEKDVYGIKICCFTMTLIATMGSVILG